MSKADLAESLFNSSDICSCAQSVLCAFEEDIGLSKETLMKMSSAFGGGIAATRGPCGAVSGMCMAAGLLHGYENCESEELKWAFYGCIEELLNEFKARNYDTITCSVLRESPRAEEIDKRNCTKYVRDAAELLETKDFKGI